MLVPKKVLSMSTGFYQREHLYPLHMELSFIYFLTDFYILKASHLNYTCIFAGKPRAQGHYHEEDSEKSAVGKNRACQKDKEERFS